jgi:hypothetical protein
MEFPRMRSFCVTLRTAGPALLCFAALGCGGDKLNRVSGKVNFNGQPVPSGMIYFMPDSSKGHTGPTGFANIKNGEYDTSSDGGRGVPSGPVIVSIEGFDTNAPPDKPKTKEEKEAASEESTIKVLFPRWETNWDVPASSSTKDFDVPAEASKGPKKAGPPAGQVNP